MTYGRDDPGQKILVGERLPWDCHRGTPDAVLLQTTWPAAHSETDAGAGVLDSDQRVPGIRAPRENGFVLKYP